MNNSYSLCYGYYHDKVFRILSDKSKNSRLFKFTIIFLLFLVNSASAHAQNLLLDGSAESDPTTNGWTAVSMGTDCNSVPNWGNGWRTLGNQGGYPTAQNGSSYFYPGCAPSNGTVYELYQDVDVSANAVAIDAGGGTFTFSGYMQVYNQSPADQSEIIVEYRDATNTTVLASYNTGYKNDINAWKLYSNTQVAPSATRYVRVRLIGKVNAGPSTDSYFDNLSLTATYWPTISGNVYDDANGLTDNTINGTGTNANNNIYANVVKASNNKVVASSLVASDGTYAMAVTSGVTYKLILTALSQTTGTTLTTSSLPSGWKSTGEFLGTGAGNDGIVDGILSTGILSANISNANFGIDQLPISDNKTFSNFNGSYFTSAQSNGNPTITGYKGVAANSAGFSSYFSTLGDMTGSDPEDCLAASSCNANKSFYISSVLSTTLLYYNGSALTAGVTISNFNPGLLTIYGQLSQSNMGFNYQLVDAAGQKSSAAATWSLTTFTTLPVQLVSFTATPNQKMVELNWLIASEENTSRYEIWHSTDADNWQKIGNVTALGNTSIERHYGFIDYSPDEGMNYYKLKIYDLNNSYTESNVVQAEITGINENNILIGPNPAYGTLAVSNMKNIMRMDIYNMNGQQIMSENVNGLSVKKLDVGKFSPGLYIILVVNRNGAVSGRIKFVKASN
ncbi:MAG TPA: T9SS type A sorting domain-containing protein [Puia sp.]|nr:T9SS type A sorting domain-containing protein [Puia sp.]